MSARTRWIIGIGGLIALLVILTPIYFYVKDFSQLPRSSNPSDWGAFGDFFGGILNPVISLLTLVVTVIIAVNISKIEKRNHDETVHSPVKPLLTIETEDFFSSDISRNGLTVDQDFYDYDVPQEPAGPYDHFNKDFYLKIINKGLGIANQVSVTFEVDINDLKQSLLFKDPKIDIKIGDVKKNEDGTKFIVLSIKADYFNYQSPFYKIVELERSGLGVIDKGEEVKAYIPIQILGAFQLHNLIRRLKPTDDTFPTMCVTFNYKNIHGKTLTEKFKVTFLHRNDYHSYSLFRIVQEQI